MRNLFLSTIALGALTLGGCGQQPAASDDGGNAAIVENGSGTATAPANDMAGIAAPTTDDDAADAEPGSAEAAAKVVERYYAAIDRGDFRSAYALWGNDGEASGQSYSGFRDGFAETASTSVAVGEPGRGEGAAGSIYIEIPVTVDAALKNGTSQHFTGKYTLRRVNDVPGSTAEQRRWHLTSADLKKD